MTTTKPEETSAVALPRLKGVKVFSATMQPDRNRLGEAVTAWLAERPMVKVIETIVTQSSDASFHCLAITIFYGE